MLRSCTLALSLLASGCALVFPAPAAMESSFDPLRGPTRARCLMVLCPGVADTADDFRRKGFVDAIRDSGASVDIVAANATLGYYLDGSATARVEADVIGPLRRRGYEQIWLVGVSLGALGSFKYALQFPQHVDGIVALAPFLGNVSVADEIRRAGGLELWTPDPPAPLTDDNAERQLWSWLHNVTTGKARGPPIYLGFGAHDGLVGRRSLLTSAIPESRILRTPGAHTWEAWRDLFAQFLSRSDFQAQCGAATLAL